MSTTTDKAKKTQSPTFVVTGKGRLSYCHIWEPHAVEEGQTKKYSLAFLIPKSDTATIEKIKAAVEAASKIGREGIWKSKKDGKLPPASKIKLPLRDGDEEKDDPVYAGHYFFNANSTNKPGVIDAAKNEVLDKAAVYSGCYGRISVNFYPFNTSGNVGVGCGLNNIQKLADGEALAGGTNAQDDFADDFEDTSNTSTPDEDDVM
jgi:hypothetical protein